MKLVLVRGTGDRIKQRSAAVIVLERLNNFHDGPAPSVQSPQFFLSQALSGKSMGRRPAMPVLHSTLFSGSTVSAAMISVAPPDLDSSQPDR